MSEKRGQRKKVLDIDIYRSRGMKEGRRKGECQGGLKKRGEREERGKGEWGCRRKEKKCV